MVILENIRLEVKQILVAKRTAVVPTYCLFDAVLAIHMSASRDVAVCDGVQTNGALKFVLELFCAYSETVVVEIVTSLVDHQNSLFKFRRKLKYS